ncbi:hypothetical protein CP532_0822, partial [Ophiocordyceps camponoti-leonardi (nom. inval.)]
MKNKSAGRLFFLSLFSLWSAPSACSSAPQADCAISPKSIVNDACASYATLDKLNGKLRPVVDHLVASSDFFSHYRLNLFNKRCPFWNDANAMCGNIGCAVETLDNEADVPEVWRARELSKLEGPRAKHPGRREQRQHPDRPLQGKLGEDVGESCVVEYDDECDERDYCVPEDESDASRGDYVSLLRNPERFTGYGGESAHQVWDAIYRENCFSRSSFPRSARLGTPSPSPAGPAARDLKHVMDAAGRLAQLQAERQQRPNVPFVASTGLEFDDECLEKRVFYRVVSGMHASISAHLCWGFLNQMTGEWQPNLACYLARLHDHPERISNLYFNYALVTRAVAKLGPYLSGSHYTFCTGDPSEDEATRAKVLQVTQQAASVPQIFDESLMFVNGEGPSLKEDFRNRFRNISRLMDCVGCDKCRLWGKIQTSGYGTALKVLFEFKNGSDEVPALKRTELVALFNTYARLGESLRAVGKFRQMAVGENVADDVEDEKDGDDESIDNEDEDEAVREFIALRLRGPRSDSLWDRVMYEVERFRAAVKIVLSGWMRAPKAFWHIISTETVRLWQFWVGLPVSPRQWKIKFPDINRDEL